VTELLEIREPPGASRCIRTVAVAVGAIHLWVRDSAVCDSEPSAEVEESWIESAPLLAAIGSRVPEAALA
jgi:hypothetical protein